MKTMDYMSTLQALRNLKVETGSLACLGCGHEHNCGIHGCAILRNAVEFMEAEYAFHEHADSLIKRMDALLHQDDSELEAYRALGTVAHLRELVQAEKDRRLWVLPCRVGDTVWYITSTMEICEAEVTGIWLNAYTNPKMWLEIKYYSRSIGEHEYKSRVDLMLGKTVFLTREEVEAALRGNYEDWPD